MKDNKVDKSSILNGLSLAFSLIAVILIILGIVINGYIEIGALVASIITIILSANNKNKNKVGKAGMIIGIIGLLLSISIILYYVISIYFLAMVLKAVLNK